MSEIVFDGKDLVVRTNLKGRKDRLVVTFDYFRDRPDTRRHGFCEGLLDRIDVDAIHIVSKENHWFQTPELVQVIKRLAPIGAQYQAVLGFGTSMGAFGAMHYAAHFGATLVLAFSPQFCIDHKRPPFDRRWKREGRALRKGWKMLPARWSKYPRAAVVFYDPHDSDAKHVDLYRGKSLLQEIRMPFSGHPCTHTLVDTGLLPAILMDLLSGRFDPEATAEDWRKARRHSANYLRALAERVRSKRAAGALAQTAAGLPGAQTPRIVPVPRDWWRASWYELDGFEARPRT